MSINVNGIYGMSINVNGIYGMSINVNGIYYVHVWEQAHWAHSAGNSAIENGIYYYYWKENVLV